MRRLRLAPDRSGLHPVRLVHGRVLFKERFAVDAIGITLASQRPSRQMRKDRRRDPHVVVDDILLGESRGGIENLLQVRELQMLCPEFRRPSRSRDLRPPLCLKPAVAAKYSVAPNLKAANAVAAGLTSSLSAHVLSNFCPAGPSKSCVFAEMIRPAVGGPMKHRTLKIAVFFFFLSAFALAQDVASFEKRVTVKKLANGLTVIVCERPEAPVFSFFTLVDAGSAQDPMRANRAGAHVRAHGVQGHRQDRHHELCRRKARAREGRGRLRRLHCGARQDAWVRTRPS